MKKIFFTCLLAVSICLAFLPAGFISAQCDGPDDPLGVGCGSASGLGTTDIRVTVARIINVLLGILGILATCLMLYAGFAWMTAGGNEEKASQARGIMYAAVVGLAIILSSYAISRYVLNELYRATTNSATVRPF